MPPRGNMSSITIRRWPTFLPTMRAVTAPMLVEPDPRPGRERSYGQGGPLGWIRVVTMLHGSSERVVTAFPQVNDPRT